MAYVGSLERMGRELRCPICLSLFTSSVSITCNHIFCNACLTESMKSASCCPVCKVPFRRREIRPAPHMDNLVAVFKSMEAAAGTSVVSTQLTPAPKVAECGGNSAAKPKRSNKKKPPSKNEKNTTKAIASCSTAKPSISKNKRIHVTPFPESETPIRPKKVMKSDEQKSKQNGDVNKKDKDKTLNSDIPESPSLSPFFWLREEEENEGGTAETLSEPPSLDTPLRHNAPTFSDIKDSDDERPIDMTPNSKAEVSEIFDSEKKKKIFEWSQRPCSPELRSTPLKSQGKLKNILDQITEVDDDEDMNLGGSFDKLDHESNVAQPLNAEEVKKKKLARPMKRKNSKLPSCGKLCTRGSDAEHQVANIPESIVAKPRQKDGSKKERNTSNGGNKVSGNNTRAVFSSDKSMNTFSPQAGGLGNEVPENQLSERIPKKDKNSRSKLEIAGDSAVKTAENKSEQRGKRIRRISDGAVAEKIRILSEAENEIELFQLHSLTKGCTQHKPLDGRSKKNIVSNTGPNTPNILPGRDQFNIGPNTPSILPGRCPLNESISTVPSVRNVSVKNGSAQPIEQQDYSGTIRSCTARNAVLKKCEGKASKFSCAFCQSDDITEGSGEMVHYHNGKQVPAAFDGGASVVHCHKNCLEWAPDVYFEDDSVFNLTNELARSKRIKCACCGIKGAALGCFETSCRKSFHFTCAKLIPECRWDNENFVMLCPLHQSSKLPRETSGLKKKSHRKLTPKGPSQVNTSQCHGNKWTWPSGSPEKWVLCCSALSAAEKGIVSEFTKIAGVPISTSWSPNVTHVIASTDMSGACKRTLKFLMAILNGKWVISIDWVKTCMELMEPVDELKFEVSTDVHGTAEGPRLGRQRVINRQPKLFDGFQFYLHGDYTKSYRGYLQDLVVAAGGTVLQRKPVSRNQKLLDDSSLILIVYSIENQDTAKPRSRDGISTGRSQADAQALACASGGKVVSSAWIIDSIAACNLQPL